MFDTNSFFISRKKGNLINLDYSRIFSFQNELSNGINFNSYENYKSSLFFWDVVGRKLRAFVSEIPLSCSGKSLWKCLNLNCFR